MEEVFSELCKG